MEGVHSAKTIVFFLLIFLTPFALAQDSNSIDANSSSDQNVLMDSNSMDSNSFDGNQLVVNVTTNYIDPALSIAKQSPLNLENLFDLIIGGALSSLALITTGGTAAIAYLIIASLVFYFLLGKIRIIPKPIRIWGALIIALATFVYGYEIVSPIIKGVLGL